VKNSRVARVLSPEDQAFIDRVDVGIRAFDEERAAKRREQGSVGSRDLTDEELRILHRAYLDGVEKMKDHPFGKSDGGHQYWRPRRVGRA
jgi:hypothetical protein